MKRQHACANKVKEQTRSHGYNLGRCIFHAVPQFVSVLMALLQQRFTTAGEDILSENHLAGKPEPGPCSFSGEM